MIYYHSRYAHIWLEDDENRKTARSVVKLCRRHHYWETCGLPESRLPKCSVNLISCEIDSV